MSPQGEDRGPPVSNGNKPPHPLTALSQTEKANSWRKIKLPLVLIQEAAMIMFEFWERQKPADKRVSWKQLDPHFQIVWCDAARMSLEMGVTIILTDAIRFVDQTNGDMGGAYAKAIRRYINDVLEG